MGDLAAPEMLVLDQSGRRSDPYNGYCNRDAAEVLGEWHRDDRLVGKEFVLGIHLSGRQRADAFREVSEYPVVNDQLVDVTLVAMFDANAATGVAFSWAESGRMLRFDRVVDSPRMGIVIRDRETETLWSVRIGERSKPVRPSTWVVFWNCAVAVACTTAAEPLATAMTRLAMWAGGSHVQQHRCEEQ